MFSELIFELVREVGPRPPGSVAEKKAAYWIMHKFGEYTPEVKVEKFQTCPRALQNLIDFVVYSYLVSVFLYFIQPIFSLLLPLTSLLILYLTRFKGMEILDKFASKAESQNVIAIFKPVRENREARKLIFSGHHDSAYFMPLFQKKYLRFIPLIIKTAIFGIFSLIFISFFKFLVLEGFSFCNIKIFNYSIYDLLIYVPLVGLGSALFFKFNTVTNVPVIGANDNLSSIAVLIGLADALSRKKTEKTEIWLVSFGSEEPGLKGSRRFVKKHIDELRNSYLVNMEMVGKGDLIVLRAEKSVGAKHSSEAVKIVLEAAEKTNLKIKDSIIGFGDTDASSFTRKGLKATTVMGVNKNNIPFYAHTWEDKPENVEEKNLQETLKLCLSIIEVVEKRN